MNPIGELGRCHAAYHLTPQGFQADTHGHMGPLLGEAIRRPPPPSLALSLFLLVGTPRPERTLAASKPVPHLQSRSHRCASNPRQRRGCHTATMHLSATTLS